MIRLPSHQRAPSGTTFASYPDAHPGGSWTRSRFFSSKNSLAFGISGLVFLLLLSVLSQSGSASLDALRDTQIGGLLQSYIGPVQRPQDVENICPDCNCTVPGSYLLSPQWSKPLPTLAEARSPRASEATIKRYLIKEISNYLWLHPHFLPEKALAPLFSQFFNCPDSLLSFNFESLQYDKPTLFMYTRTGNGGRLKANERRMNYFRKHIETIRAYNELVEAEGFRDGLQAKDRQFIWIIIEDAEFINDTLDGIMKRSGIRMAEVARKPHCPLSPSVPRQPTSTLHMVRLTFTETHSGMLPNELSTFCETLSLAMGQSYPWMTIASAYFCMLVNAQRAHRASTRIMPELLQRIWKVNKAVLYQVGNLGGKQDLWEGPEFKNGKIVDWIIGGMPHRLFPIDMAFVARVDVSPHAFC